MLWSCADRGGSFCQSGRGAAVSYVFTKKGTHNLKVVYGGDTDFAGSTSAVFVHTVN